MEININSTKVSTQPKSHLRCANCGQLGHVYKKCSEPITSYGVICTRLIDDERYYLMIRRKDSLAYVEFLRGKYLPHNHEYIAKLVSHMTFDEQARLLKNSFQTLWRWLWQIDDCMSFRREYDSAFAKFEQLRGAHHLETIVLGAICNGTGFQETEWGFAKGRRNIGESDSQCAMREFYEETGMSQGVELVVSDDTVEETFVGSNGMTYRHVYFIATVKNPGIEPHLRRRLPNREVGAVAWFDYDGTQARIREYNKERKRLIEDVHGGGALPHTPARAAALDLQ